MFGVEMTSPHEKILAGMSLSGHERNHFFLNVDAGRDFAELSSVSGADSIYDGRSFGLLDYDRDGWTDFAVVNSNRPGFQLFRNRIAELQATPNHMIAVRLVGGNDTAAPSSEFSNRDGFGARIEVEAGVIRKLVEHRSHDGYCAQNSATMIVGVGRAAAVDRLTVRWPSGRVQEASALPVGRLVTVYENPAHAPGGEAFVLAPYEPAPSAPAPSWAATRRHGRWPRAATAPSAAERVLYVTMATWCAACAGEIADLRQLRAAFSARELAIVGVPVDEKDTADALAAWVRDHEAPYRLATIAAEDRAAVRASVEREVGRYALPASVVTDRKGHVLSARLGPPTVSEIRRLLP